jgi:Flp pilus assembly protein TadD
VTAAPRNHSSKVACAALVAVAAALPYARTFDVPFTLDDEPCIVRNPAVRRLAADAPAGPVASLCAPPSRALGEWTLAVNYRLGGLDPAGYHAVNLAIHVGSALLVLALAWLLQRAPALRSAEEEGPLLPVLAALLFAVHPLQTQAVTYVVQRYASLATMLYLLAVVLYLWHRLRGPGAARWAAYLGALAATVAAMWTKEIAFTLPLALLLCEAVAFRGPWGRRGAGLVPFLATLGILPALLIDARTVSAGADAVDSALRGMASNATMSRWGYLVTQLRVTASYLRLLVLPVGQNLDHDVPLRQSLLDPAVLASLALVAGLIGLAAWVLARPRREGEAAPAEPRVAALGILWLFLTLSVESSFVPLPDLLVEHRLYLPSVGAALSVAALASLVRRLAARRPPAGRWLLSALAMPVLALAAATAARNEVWRDEIRLWEDVAAKSPAKARVRLELGRLYLEAGRLGEAEEALREAIRLAPRDPAPWSTLGVVLRRAGRPADALESYRQARALGPDRADVHYNMGLVLAGERRLDEAIAELSTASRLQPGSAEMRNALGTALAQAGRLDEAEAAFRDALRIDPSHAGARRNLERVARARGR